MILITINISKFLETNLKMVEYQDDITNTKQHPNISIIVPTHEHPLKEQAKLADDLFWEKVNEENKEESEAEVVVTESVKEFNEEVKKFVTRFDKDFKEASRLMGLAAADEKKPFEEKYQARALLEAMTKDLEGKQEWLDQSMLIKCAKALLLNKLGSNYYDAEEISMSERHNQ